MNPMSRAIGIVLDFVGFVWFFQGIGVAQGSDMSGNPWWAVLGAAFVVAGFVVLFRAHVAAKQLIADEEAAEASAAAAKAPGSDDAEQGHDGDEGPDAVQKDQ